MQARNYWIMKPAGSSRGRGIFVFNDIGAVSYTECVIVQRYIERPLLLDGYKFDLRLYVCVTSMNPLEAFIYREGFTRLSTEPYSTDPRDMSNRYIHLTNSSINRHNDNQVQQRSILARGELSGGSKCSLKYLQTRLREMGIEWAPVWHEVVGVCLKTLYCVQDVIPGNANSFELFGFDVLIDADLKPWLIEVNSSPSLSRENALDYEIKDRMVHDTLLLATPPAFDRDLLSELLKKRLSERPKSRWNLDKDLPGWMPAQPYLACPCVPRRATRDGRARALHGLTNPDREFDANRVHASALVPRSPPRPLAPFLSLSLSPSLSLSSSLPPPLSPAAPLARSREDARAAERGAAPLRARSPSHGKLSTVCNGPDQWKGESQSMA
jgi:hypothetical protein